MIEFGSRSYDEGGLIRSAGSLAEGGENVIHLDERSPADEGDGAAWGVRWCHGPIVDLVDDPDFAGLPAGN